MNISSKRTWVFFSILLPLLIVVAAFKIHKEIEQAKILQTKAKLKKIGNVINTLYINLLDDNVVLKQNQSPGLLDSNLLKYKPYKVLHTEYGEKLFVDSWGNILHVHIDNDNDNLLRLDGALINEPILIWSNGPNGKNEFGKVDDIVFKGSNGEVSVGGRR